MPKFYWRFNHTHICIYKAGWKVECHNVAGKKGKTNCGGQVAVSEALCSHSLILFCYTHCCYVMLDSL